MLLMRVSLFWCGIMVSVCGMDMGVGRMKLVCGMIYVRSCLCELCCNLLIFCFVVWFRLFVS